MPPSTPTRCGIGLRAAHHREVLRTAPDVGWFEAHSENYFADGGGALDTLLRVRERWPVALHGVGLGLGSTAPLDREHLRRLARLAARIEPWAVSEHVCWGQADGRHTNDLLPMPRTGESLRHLAARVAELQDALGRQVLLENVSSYLEFTGAEFTEAGYLAALVAESGCALLLDVNNVYVNACNHGFDAEAYFDELPVDAVREIHLAGHEPIRIAGRVIRIDTHDRPVCDEVWALCASARRRFGRVPTLIEWDADLPPLGVLVAEAQRADALG
ncbi:MAG TPA: DUF692 domain-containing protein [Steroidobacteraceae bacterium]|nr:DUF692 domain-containing protein [Steroidobacteraceae bacterium]HNS27576.1 DUF692 domain-containing protein [Steroidobacteraceae bacterium]